MRNFKRIFALLLAVVMMLGLTATAYANDGTGSITIENSVNGEIYTVYKIFDATYDGSNVAYTATANVVSAMESYASSSGTTCPFTFELNSQGTYNVTTTSEASTIANWLKGFLGSGQTVITAADSKTGTGGTLEFTGLDFGYYYISTTTGSVVTINTVAPEATVIDKNQETTNGTKKMTVDGEDYTEVSVAYGTVINFTVSLDATNYVGETKVTSYTITDTLSNGLELDTSSIVVKVSDITLTAGTNYTITSSSSSGFTIVINWVDSNGASLYDSDATITVTYSATVTELGDYNGESETNTATFFYNSTKINETTTTVYVYGFELVKTDSSNNYVLGGAEFTLYYDAECTSAVTLVKQEDGSYRVATSSDNDTTTTIEAGNVKIYGLAAGTYYLKETKAPDGYIALTEAATVIVGSTGTEVTLSDDETYYVSGGVEVENTAGSELPSTGGMGTTVIYIIGAVLVLAAGVILVAKKRMNRA